jgi:DUF2971 family protein
MLGILRSKTLWATRIQYLSDASEFKYTLGLLVEAIQRRQRDVMETKSELFDSNFRSGLVSILDGMTGMFERLFRSPYHVACFSEDGDSLDQWRAYCHSGPGFSIGFDSKQLMASFGNQSCFIAPCVYEPSKQRKLVEELLGTFLMDPFTRKFTDAELRTQVEDFLYDSIFLASVFKNPSIQERERNACRDSGDR